MSNSVHTRLMEQILAWKKERLPILCSVRKYAFWPDLTIAAKNKQYK
jgi:hypothetical protein